MVSPAVKAKEALLLPPQEEKSKATKNKTDNTSLLIVSVN
ncbi:hypothetical protein HMPREF9445_01359 [Bacteroides clarus YIT 12056]|uniref:Uncharacterized protein n=1 Tax=Bacteroides clarus YIT 12056 TaxID=762984 RepID=A0ABP2KTV9_9BACE|nr:hypothetical protein HMPREF9445_01359 [Bacteroides clarus YIT 12056]